MQKYISDHLGLDIQLYQFIVASLRETSLQHACLNLKNLII